MAAGSLEGVNIIVSATAGLHSLGRSAVKLQITGGSASLVSETEGIALEGAPGGKGPIAGLVGSGGLAEGADAVGSPFRVATNGARSAGSS